MAADGLAELQVRYPNVPIVFCETRKLAEEWTYRYLAASLTWLDHDGASVARVEAAEHRPDPTDAASPGPAPPEASAGTLDVDAGPTAREVRRWATEHGLTVADRGRLRPDVVQAWHDAHPVR